MSKHTLGPWQVVGPHSDGKWTIQSERRDCIAMQYGDSGLYNARLIAAAPEMLEALEEAEGLLLLALQLPWMAETKKESDAEPGSIAFKVRAAIAKATGEAP